ncbi:LAME_0B01948g1_1 [Lachancea meyersii CBS 8951]|uniref:LAME_0B01948g1_1 n=1 Tax=Lachancea meyersii CBS 8951 TaxID=1266667 RepID=A0A1G4ITG3_9SACH|nr:LAME_0B01948g1_1 [Lachancea meyersii CBS 8951]
MYAQTPPLGQDVLRLRHSSEHGEIPRHAFHRGRDVERYAMNKDDFTAASMGKFSECLFRSGRNKSVSRPLTFKSDLSVHAGDSPRYGSTSSLPAFTRTTSYLRRNSPSANIKSSKSQYEKVADKGLVYQFLNVEDGSAAKPEAQVLHSSQPSITSLSSQDERLPRLVLCDLKDASTVQEGTTRGFSTSSPSSRPNCTPGLTLADEISKFDNCIRGTLTELATKELAMKQASEELESLQKDIHRTQETIKQIQSQLAYQDIKKVQCAFDTENNASFISRFTNNIQSYSEELAAFERHIGKCKVELTNHKATVHKFETTIKLNEMLRDCQDSMCVIDRLREYKGILTDLFALVLIVVLSILLKKFLIHRKGS